MFETRFGGSPLEFGLFDWIEWNQAPARDIFEQRLQMLEYADQAGFFCYHLAEHHVTSLSVAPSPTVFLAAAAQRTRRLRLGPLVYLLPFYNPLRLLHEICMLDHLSNGRLELGVGRGISPIEAGHFQLPADELHDIFRETLDILLTAFTSDRLTYAGKYHSYKDIRLWMQPLQKPYPLFGMPVAIVTPYPGSLGMDSIRPTSFSPLTPRSCTLTCINRSENSTVRHRIGSTTTSPY